jgi:GMP synthase-like glutamine amidotransferase
VLDIAVFCFSPMEGPAYFGEWVSRERLPWRLFRLHEGDAVPARSTQFSGIAMMGGQVSANDPLPWIPPMLDFIRDAVNNRIPRSGIVLGVSFLPRRLALRL